MEPLAAAMMTGDALASPMHVGALLVFSPPPGVGEHYVDDLYRAAVLGTDPLDPRMRRRPHIGPQTLGMWTWQDVEVDLSAHLQRRILPPGLDRQASERALWQLIADLHGIPLDRRRPQWMAYLIDGLPDGRFAFYIKVHHTLVDGVAGMQMIIDGLSPDPNQRSAKHFYVAPGRPPHDERPTQRSTLSSLVRVATSSVALARSIIGGGADYLAGAVRGDSPPPLTAPFTRFNKRLGHRRAVAGGSWPLSRIRAIEDAVGVTDNRVTTDRVTTNDVLTAVIAGALRAWLQAHDELPRRSLVGFCPVAVRIADGQPEPERGNLFGLQQCPLGTDLDDPVARLTLIHHSMRWAKREVARRGSSATAVLTVPNLAPSLLLSLVPLIPKWRTGYNVPISNVRGPETDMYFNGAHLDALYPISTVFDGLGLNVTMCSYAGTVSIGYVAGRNLVPDIQTLIPMTEAALAELERAVGVGGD